MPTLELSPDASSPRAARHFVAGILEANDIDRLTIEDAALLATELVTNAVIHARTDITLKVVVQDGIVDIAVTDRGEGSPVLQTLNHQATTGRGLYLLDQIAQEWEVIDNGDSKTVRCSLMPSSVSSPQ